MNTTSGNVNLFGRTFTWLDVQLNFYSRNFVIFHFSTVNGEGNSTFPLQYPPGGEGLLPSNRLIGMCCWMGSHFHNWIDYNGFTFLLELLEWDRTFSGFGGSENSDFLLH